MRQSCATAAALLLARAAPGDPNECWVWPGKPATNGYGRVVGRYAHRVSHEAFIGPIPEGQGVLHRCDNPPCWNPAHLFAGTALANNRDRVEKGRGYHGERHHSAKLTPDDVRAIRASDLSGPALAKQYGVQFSAIYKIKDGRSWAHVK